MCAVSLRTTGINTLPCLFIVTVWPKYFARIRSFWVLPLRRAVPDRRFSTSFQMLKGLTRADLPSSLVMKNSVQPPSAERALAGIRNLPLGSIFTDVLTFQLLGLGGLGALNAIIQHV